MPPRPTGPSVPAISEEPLFVTMWKLLLPLAPLLGGVQLLAKEARKKLAVKWHGGLTRVALLAADVIEQEKDVFSTIQDLPARLRGGVKDVEEITRCKVSLQKLNQKAGDALLGTRAQLFDDAGLAVEAIRTAATSSLFSGDVRGRIGGRAEELFDLLHDRNEARLASQAHSAALKEEADTRVAQVEEELSAREQELSFYKGQPQPPASPAPTAPRAARKRPRGLH